VGYGASQVIPVISGCLYPSRSPLVVEEPEIHLHPKAQGTVAQLLCETSLHRQVIVETHSVHMINRARLLVARGELPKDHVIIHYVSRNRSGSHVTTIPLTSDGDFATKWPEGFFDERYQDTLRLLELKKG
jgi:predicted ATPase